MDIKSGKGSAYNIGYIDHSEIRVERMKGEDGRHGFLLSSPKKTYLFVSACIYNTPKERDDAIKQQVLYHEQTGR